MLKASDENQVLQNKNLAPPLSLLFALSPALPAGPASYSHEWQVKEQHSLFLMYYRFKEEIPQLQRASCGVIIAPSGPLLAKAASATQLPGEFLPLEGSTEWRYLFYILSNTLRASDTLIPLTGICEGDSSQYLFSS